MKIYIIGPVASGKTTLAERLSATGINNTALDEIVYEPDKTSQWGNGPLIL